MIVAMKDREAIEAFFRRDPALHAYELGDLEDGFFERARYFAAPGPAGKPAAVVLAFDSADMTTLIALASDDPNERVAALRVVRDIGERHPRKFYAHLSVGLSNDLVDVADIQKQGIHQKLVWKDRKAIAKIDTTGVEPIDASHADEVKALLDAAYPGHFFDPQTLSAGPAFGVREGGALVSFAGLHVYAPSRHVAALGNIATREDQRKRGHAKKACAALCRALHDAGTETVGLNVGENLTAAQSLYQSLGFVPVAKYEEVILDFAGPRSKRG